MRYIYLRHMHENWYARQLGGTLWAPALFVRRWDIYTLKKVFGHCFSNLTVLKVIALLIKH